MAKHFLKEQLKFYCLNLSCGMFAACCRSLMPHTKNYKKLKQVRKNGKQTRTEAWWSPAAQKKGFGFILLCLCFAFWAAKPIKIWSAAAGWKLILGFGACINKWSACSDRFLITQTAVDILDARAYGTRWGIDRYKKMEHPKTEDSESLLTLVPAGSD